MFSYSTGYYVSPPDDQYLKFKNRCSLVRTYFCFMTMPVLGTDQDRNRNTWLPSKAIGISAYYATRRKCRYEANKCGWTQPLFRKARDCGIN